MKIPILILGFKGWQLNGVSTVSQNDVFLFVTSALYKLRILSVSHLFEVKGKEKTEISHKTVNSSTASLNH